MDKLTSHLKDHVSGKLNGKARSGHWHTLREKFLLKHPKCALCGGTKELEVHHKAPFHTHPELELDENNLITLCEANHFGVNCHLLFGHLGSYKQINLDVEHDVELWSIRLKHLVPLLEAAIQVETAPLISDPADSTHSADELHLE